MKFGNEVRFERAHFQILSNTNAGVSQGSILFLIFVNSLFLDVSMQLILWKEVQSMVNWGRWHFNAPKLNCCHLPTIEKVFCMTSTCLMIDTWRVINSVFLVSRFQLP